MKDPYQYHLKYGDIEAPKYLDVYRVFYGPPGSPAEHRYFYGVRDGIRVCFIKRCGRDQVRHKIEVKAARINSPYIAACYRNPLLRDGKLEYYDGDVWRELGGEMRIYEYLPCNLEIFRQRYLDKHTDIPDPYRRQILLKLVQGIAHGHQAQIIHRDIKPGNILINCFELCEEAPWEHREELDVKLIDFDASHDGRYTTPEVDTVSEPFQPWRSPTSTVWLDLYSLCMVILWLYDSIDGHLFAISDKLPHTVAEVEEILEKYGAQLPCDLSQVLIPFLVKIIRKMDVCEPYENEWSESAEWLSRLYRDLAGIFQEYPEWSPMELLGPEGESQTWSAVVQIDKEFWPVLGQGMEYHILSVIDRQPAGGLGSQQVEMQYNGRALIPYYSGKVPGASAGQGPVETYFAPPEIFLAGEQEDSGWSLRAGIFGSQMERQEGSYERRCLAQADQIREGADVKLFNGPPVRIRQNETIFFQDVHIRFVQFFKDREGPEPLPAFPEQTRSGDANINLVFVMPRPRENEQSDCLGCRLIRQVVESISRLEQCRPCYYGVNMVNKSPYGWSFCGGRLNLSPETLSEGYRTSMGPQSREDRVWSHQERPGKRSEARYSFDPGLPTIVIGLWDRPLDWTTDPVRNFKTAAEMLSPDFRYAVEYLQLFTTDQAEGVERLAPWLAAAVRADGACVLTPVSEDREEPDPDGRWLTAALRWCQRGQI